MLSIDQLAGLLAGLGVALLAGGLARAQDVAAFRARLRAFVDVPATRKQMPVRTTARRAGAGSIWPRLPILRGLRVLPEQITQAGLALTIQQFVAIQALGGIAGVLAFLVVANKLELFGIFTLIFASAGVLFGYWLPKLSLSLLRLRRLGQFERRFPGTVDAIANALQAGLSLPQSLEAIARETPAPVGTEFGRVVREMGMGLSINDALAGLFQRVPLVDLDMFVTAINIQYRIGGNLSQILRTIAHTVRERLRIRAEVKTLTAQQRLSSVIVSLAPVVIAVFVSFVNPTYMSALFEPGLGRVMLVMAVAGIAVGFYAMMRIADIEI